MAKWGKLSSKTIQAIDAEAEQHKAKLLAARQDLDKENLDRFFDYMEDAIPDEKEFLDKYREEMIAHMLDGTKPSPEHPLRTHRIRVAKVADLEEALSPCEMAIGVAIGSGVVFTLACLGAASEDSVAERAARETLREIGPVFNGLEQSIGVVADALENKEAFAAAKGLFTVLNGFAVAGGIKVLAKHLAADMTWWDYTEEGGVWIGQMVIWFASDGAAAIAEYLLRILAAANMYLAFEDVPLKCK